MRELTSDWNHYTGQTLLQFTQYTIKSTLKSQTQVSLHKLIHFNLPEEAHFLIFQTPWKAEVPNRYIEYTPSISLSPSFLHSFISHFIFLFTLLSSFVISSSSSSSNFTPNNNHASSSSSSRPSSITSLHPPFTL
jgi:hypothetical protein